MLYRREILYLVIILGAHVNTVGVSTDQEGFCISYASLLLEIPATLKVLGILGRYSENGCNEKMPSDLEMTEIPTTFRKSIAAAEFCADWIQFASLRIFTRSSLLFRFLLLANRDDKTNSPRLQVTSSE